MNGRKQHIMHAFFSKTAQEQGCPTFICKDKRGNHIYCTAVCDTKEEGEQCYKWPDKEYRGEVVEFVQRLEY